MTVFKTKYLAFIERSFLPVNHLSFGRLERKIRTIVYRDCLLTRGKFRAISNCLVSRKPTDPLTDPKSTEEKTIPRFNTCCLFYSLAEVFNRDRIKWETTSNTDLSLYFSNIGEGARSKMKPPRDWVSRWLFTTKIETDKEPAVRRSCFTVQYQDFYDISR